MIGPVSREARDVLLSIQYKDCEDNKAEFPNAYYITWPVRTEILVVSDVVALEDFLSFYPLLTQKNT